MLAIIENLSRNPSHVTLGRFPTLQAYLVPIKKDCKHIWSDSDLRLKPHLVPFLSRLQAFGPCHKKLLQPYVVHPYII